MTDPATVAPRVLQCGCTVIEEDRPHYDPRLRKKGWRSTTVLRVQATSPHCPEMGYHGPSRRD